MNKKPEIIWGGVDVNPKLYGEEKHFMTQDSNDARDTLEMTIINKAIREGRPVIGVCRGAQLLCVANGGKLHQHTKPHKQNHGLVCSDGSRFEHVSAGHHQIMIPNPDVNHIVLAWNPSYVTIFSKNMTERYETNTPEIVWFPETHCLAIQPHPEWETKDSEFVKWLNGLIKELGIDYVF